MRTTLIIQLGIILVLGTTAKGQNPGFSSKSSFSKCAPPPAAADATPTPPVLKQGRLARITAYWPGEDYYTSRRRSATGARLRFGFCAVDSQIIPYGSLVTISGIGAYLAMDTGTAVINRKAARESGHSHAERSALVIDLFFPTRKAGEAFGREGPKFAIVAWQNTNTLARD